MKVTQIGEADIQLKDAVEFFGMPLRTLHRKIKNGTAPESYVVGRCRFFRAAPAHEYRAKLIAASQNAQ